MTIALYLDPDFVVGVRFLLITGIAPSVAVAVARGRRSKKCRKRKALRGEEVTDSELGLKGRNRRGGHA